MTPRILAATFLVACATFLVAPAAHAAAPGPCLVGPLNHTPMAGTYVGDDGSQFALNIYPCGGTSELFWTDVYGIPHTQKYQTMQTLEGGGWIGYIPGGYSAGPWGTSTMGYKPAERGAIQLIFWAPSNYAEPLLVRHGLKV